VFRRNFVNGKFFYFRTEIGWKRCIQCDIFPFRPDGLRGLQELHHRLVLPTEGACVSLSLSSNLSKQEPFYRSPLTRTAGPILSQAKTQNLSTSAARTEKIPT